MKGSYIPDRGDLVWISLDPRTSKEQSGHRPALVLSRKLFSTRVGLAVICPVTSKIKGLPFEIVLSGSKTKGAVLPIHIRSIDFNSRRIKFIEKLPPELVEEVDRQVKLIVSG